MKNLKGIIVIIFVLALTGIPLLDISRDTYLISVIISVLMILLTLFLRKRIKNKLIYAHIVAALYLYSYGT